LSPEKKKKGKKTRAERARERGDRRDQTQEKNVHGPQKRRGEGGLAGSQILLGAQRVFEKGKKDSRRNKRKKKK